MRQSLRGRQRHRAVAGLQGPLFGNEQRPTILGKGRTRIVAGHAPRPVRLEPKGDVFYPFTAAEDGTCKTEKCIELLVTGFKKAIGDGTRRHESKLTLDGAPRRVIQLDGLLHGEERVRVLIAVLDRREGRRVLHCFGRPEHEPRCRAAFEAMSGLAWRAGVPSFFDADRIAFVGREYETPPGCVAQANHLEGAVDCGSDSNIWRVTADAAADEAALIQPYSRLKMTEKRVECAVDGSTTTCRSFRASDGRNIGLDVAHAVVRGKTVVVMCGNLSGTLGIPRACSGVLAFHRQPGR